jgi:hypothetical protein
VSKLGKKLITAAAEGAAIARGQRLPAHMRIPAGNGLLYAIKLTRDDNDTLLVTCPDLPELTTFGVDVTDAIERAKDAITLPKQRLAIASCAA